MKKLAVFLVIGVLAWSSSAHAAPDVSKVTFSNGFRLLVKPEPGRGVVALSLVIRAGALEQEDQPGLGQVLARTLFTGAKGLSPGTLASLSNAVGGSFAVTWDLDYTEVYISTTKDELNSSVGLLSEIILHPKITSDAVAAAKAELLNELISGKDSAFRMSYDAIRRMLYTDSPYRQPFLGSPDSINSITAADLRQFTAKWFVPSNMVLAVAGDVTTEEAMDAGKLWFGKQKATPVPERPDVPDETLQPSGPKVLEMNTDASYVIAGTLASSMTSPHFAADMVVATVLGGGKASRMFRELRDQQGLAYELGTLYPPLLYQSHIIAYVLAPSYVYQAGDAGGKPTVEAIRVALKDTVDSLRSRPITQAELDRAKHFIIGSFALQHERLHQRAKHLALYEALGLGYDFDSRFPGMVSAVTLTEARERAKQLFSRSAMVVVIPKE